MMKKAIRIRDNENIESMIEMVAEAGYRYVDVGLMWIPREDTWEQQVKKIAGLLKESGLQCVQTHLPCYGPLVSSEQLDEATENAIIKCIIASSILGAEWCVYHPRSAVNSGWDKKHSFDDNRAVLETYLECAKKQHVGVAVENMALFPGPVWYGVDYHDVMDLVDSFDDDSMKACWDFGHAHTAGFDHIKALAEMGNRIKCTHIHDNLKSSDAHLVPFLGSIEWDEIMPQFKKIGYEGALALELHYQSKLVHRSTSVLKSYIQHSFSCIDYLDRLMEKA